MSKYISFLLCIQMNLSLDVPQFGLLMYLVLVSIPPRTEVIKVLGNFDRYSHCYFTSPVGVGECHLKLVYLCGLSPGITLIFLQFVAMFWMVVTPSSSDVLEPWLSISFHIIWYRENDMHLSSVLQGVVCHLIWSDMQLCLTIYYNMIMEEIWYESSTYITGCRKYIGGYCNIWHMIRYDDSLHDIFMWIFVCWAYLKIYGVWNFCGTSWI